jgi:hypothetical protein
VETVVARHMIASDPAPETEIVVDFDGKRLFIRE